MDMLRILQTPRWADVSPEHCDQQIVYLPPECIEQNNRYLPPPED